MSQPEHGLEHRLSKILRAGVMLSGIIVAFGGIIFIARHGAEPFVDRPFASEPSWLRDPIGIATAAVSLQGRGLIQLGLLVLIATPVVRVILAALSFLRERDYTYVVITLIVLGVLTYSFFAGQVL